MGIWKYRSAAWTETVQTVSRRTVTRRSLGLPAQPTVTSLELPVLVALRSSLALMDMRRLTDFGTS